MKARYEPHAIVPATQAHVDALKGRLRKADCEEIAASCGYSPDFALQLSFQTSELCWAGLARGVDVVTIFGVVRPALLSTTGVPWMLGAEELARVGTELGKRTRYYVRQMKRRFELLENHIDARQTQAIRWLQWAGFHVEPAEPWGVQGRPFHRFFME